jgi:hypothetical protein
VDLGGRRVIPQLQNDTAVFRTVQVGAEQGAVVEILSGLTVGDEVISTGAGALRDGDRVAVAGRTGGRGRRGDGQPGATSDGSGTGPRGGVQGDPPAAGGGGGTPPQGGARSGDATPPSRGNFTGREGSSGRRGDGSGGTGSREGREGRRSGGDGSGRRGGNGTSQPSGVSQ